MKSSRPVVKSSRMKVVNPSANDALTPNTRHGETLIPEGTADVGINLPALNNTYTYNIINTDKMSGNITLKTSGGGSMIGLMLHNAGGISIEPIVSTTSEVTIDSNVKDGAFIQTLSNGNNWYVWSVATGGTVSTKSTGINGTFTQTIVRSFADVSNVTITSDIRFVGPIGQEARHDLIFSGEGDPGAFLTISETTGNSDAAAVLPITIPIANDGTWSLDKTILATNLPNGSYKFDFTPTRGNGVSGKTFTKNTGAIAFNVPSAFSPDPAEVVDFAAGASAVKPDGTPITVTVDSTAWNSSLVHGDTFSIIYSITDAAVNGGVTVSQTVSGEIVDDTPPAAPVISAASIANINELSANGTAEPGKTITLFQDSLALSPTVTSHASTGAWSIGPITLSLNSNFTLKAQASEPGVGNPNRSAFGEYSPAFNYVQPQVTKPTLTIDGETKSTWSNTAGTLTLRGTTEAGSTIAITANGQAVSPASGPTVVGTDWTATLTVANESQTNFKATATLANHLSNESDPYGLLIDRVAPAITLTGGVQTVGLPNVGSSNDLGFSASDSSSGVATSTSNWDTQVSTTAEGTYTVTYNADDVAGNSATPVTRDVTVTTEVIIPVITNVTVNGDGTFTVTGTVTGTYADNLTVQVTIDGSNSGSPVAVSSGAFTHTTSAQSPGTYAFKARSINSATDESTLSFAQSATIAVPDITAPAIVIKNDADNSVITDQTVSITEGDTFSFTATATDNVDGDISGNIVTGGDTLDTTAAGTYNLTFSVSDSASPNPNTDSATLTVEVAAAASFVEDLASVVTRAASTANISIGGGKVTDSNNNSGGSGLIVKLETDGLIAYDSGTGETVNDEFTISFWADLDSLSGNRYFIGTDQGRRLYFYIGGTTNSTFRMGWHNGSSNQQHFKTSAGDFTSWTHFVIRVEETSTNIVISAFINGAKVGLSGSQLAPLGTKILPPQSNEDFKFGGTVGKGSSTNSVSGQYDSIQFGDGIALTDSQIAAMYAQSDRQMTIATASGL